MLCEKSIALSYSEFSEMRAVAEEYGVVLLEAMRPTFDPMLKIVKSAILIIGKIRRASFTFCQYSSHYDKFKMGIVENAFDPSIGNSALWDIGVYPLWLGVELFGEPKSLISKKIYLENSFLGMGESILYYGDKLVSVSYSKINDSPVSSVVEGELGSIIDKITEPSRISIAIRGEPERKLLIRSRKTI